MATNSVYYIGQIIELTHELNIGGCRMKGVAYMFGLLTNENMEYPFNKKWKENE